MPPKVSPASRCPRKARPHSSRRSPTGRKAEPRSTSTDAVHPDNRNAAIRATSAIGLDVAGVDFLIPIFHDPMPKRAAASAKSISGRASSFTWRRCATVPRDMGGPIIDSLFQDDGRIPIIAVLDQRRTGCADRLASLLSASGRNLAVLDGDQFTRIIRGARKQRAARLACRDFGRPARPGYSRGHSQPGIR